MGDGMCDGGVTDGRGQSVIADRREADEAGTFVQSAKEDGESFDPYHRWRLSSTK